MSRFRDAVVADILWAAQKDDYYLQYAKNLCAESIQGTIGVYHWLKWQNMYETASDFTYFLLTTLSGFQTLGEEYVHIVQVNSSHSNLPSLYKRVLSIVLQVLGPLTFQFLRRELLIEIQRYAKQEISTSRKINVQKCFNFVTTVLWSMSIIQRMHFIVFLFNGKFFHLSKRISGIRYVLIRRYLGNLNSQQLYSALGILSTVQLIILLIQDYKKFLNPLTTAESEILHGSVNEESLQKNQCSLCLNTRKDSSLTPCGHLFCWNCITSWLQTKEACPLCREKFGPSRLVYLQNYHR